MKTTLAAILAGLVACSPLAQGPKPVTFRPAAQSKAGGAKPADVSGAGAKVTMYLMSKCPYGVVALEGMRKAVGLLGGKVELELNYIASEQGGKWRSLHGEAEIVGNIQQLCAHEVAPAKWLAFVGCVNAGWQTIPLNGPSCAQEVGLDAKRFQSCVAGPRGRTLLRASALRAEAAGAVGSPTIFIAGRAYEGGRGPLDFAREICSRSRDMMSVACAKLPQPVRVEAIVLHDSRCKRKSCVEFGPNLSEMLRRRLLPGVKVRQVEYQSPEGRKLYTELGLRHLPAWIIDKRVKKARNYDQIARWIVPAGDQLVLRVPADFDPTAEICDNDVDDTNNGRVDCKDPGCANFLGCRALKKQHLSVFVMSQCPYGVRALDAMKDVIANFGEKLSFEVHYIAQLDAKKESGFDALHGDEEAYENMRQLCAKKHYPRNHQYLKYIWCRNADITSKDWKACAKGGISARKIERCMKSGEGKKLLAKDVVMAKNLQINASPTWIANNRHKFLGVTPEAIRRHVCAQNKGLAGCEKKLSDKTDVPLGGACGK
ncbi:MAG: hypothetical protein JRH20_14360 [Deltaproteobacteria bacterium]|nr:hypothetical protein [Deltaproteobacteria bacterium]